LPMISDDTILRDLKELTRKGIAKKQGSTKSARYILR
jgi:predicted HTH transcriptional regulator